MGRKPLEAASIESKAALWGDTEYREWVQSQIASKMFLRLGGITVASALGLAVLSYRTITTAATDLENRLSASVTTAVVPDVTENVIGIVPLHVAQALLDQSKLVEVTVETALEEMQKQLPTLVQKPEFVEPAAKAVFQAMTSSGASQRIILDETYRQMVDGESPAARALALRLYVLFHSGVSDRQSIDPLSKTLSALLTFDDGGSPPPALLIDAALEQYLLGKSGW